MILFLQLLRELPAGCRKAAEDGTRAELSLNLAVANLSEEGCSVKLSMRSNSGQGYEELKHQVLAIGEAFMMPFREQNHTPMWEYDPESKLLRFVQDCAAREGRRLTPAIIHASVEEGIFREISESAGFTPDMIGLGCTTLEMHTPRERLEVASVGKTYALLKSILANWF